ncbi:putative Flavonol synthase [Mycena sanguinolenta]|uniref:Putative Flavonol synthase n=1 Tax=Mycena sanguinolenta TaxID=230812 RepID=A0A8H6Y4T8_9AGAR|nr:putative Flavonol synthase [Mycena sanguinolenta]
MPVVISPYDNIPPWTRPAETKALDWAPLKEIDLSLFDSPGGKEKLAAELHDAVKNGSYSSNAIFLPSGVISLTVGFWVVTGHGIPDEEVLRQFSIGNAFFNLVRFFSTISHYILNPTPSQPVEEKQKHSCNFAVGEYFGYREPKPIGSTGVKENHEMLNIPKYTANEDYKGVPKHDIVLAHEAEIAAFQRKLFDKVARKLFILRAIILESLTLLFSQNVAGLQIRTPQGDWKFVKPVEGGITVNSADVLQFLTKGYVKSTIHRVVGPQPDQAHLHRLGLLYFVRPGDDTPIIPVPSPVLERAGLLTSVDKKADPKTAVRGYDWTRARVENAHNRTSSTVAFENQTEKTFKFKGLEVVDRWQ